MNKKIKEAIEKKDPMWWTYHVPDYTARTAVSGWELRAHTCQHENGATVDRRLYISGNFDNAIRVDGELREAGVVIDPPKEFWSRGITVGL